MTSDSETTTHSTGSDSPAESAEPSSAASATKRRRVPIWLRVIVFSTCYVLSIGPMFWVWYDAEHVTGNPLIRVFYTPLRLLCAIPLVEEWLNRYINWWIA
ncbi:MAG: hypothetical protein ACYTGL_15740 [Planctomycetota bacterium]|jgi:hypothetical protein